MLLLETVFEGVAADTRSGFSDFLESTLLVDFLEVVAEDLAVLPALADGADFLLGPETFAGGFFDTLLGAGFGVDFGFDANRAWLWDNFGLVFKQRTGGPYH